ncbi:hypothetical protein GBQ70_07535 [Halomicrobium sp. ZPS1]|uniref:Uncharacterized protein n=2 Tax=Halomicrobium mukohataei TaxID=57705 RepID=C7P0M2_HALMD|nr:MULTISPECIES: hypothetical protein [Halomicrobium]ACV47004.1 hypothetical protein Hmuk_0874 [Halomicrobium mukohataei DSM 12286]QCD65497.1 hypothetical protein E5139_07540 [Halomicrobium mukohataei]QFR20303.1 hypothetical protein GBQ70_07535 [Halomicrobium sp. ZPS1]
MKDIEESVSGFKRRGGWVNVVEHGERIVQALRELDDEDGVEQIDRPDLLGGDEARGRLVLRWEGER